MTSRKEKQLWIYSVEEDEQTDEGGRTQVGLFDTLQLNQSSYFKVHI